MSRTSNLQDRRLTIFPRHAIRRHILRSQRRRNAARVVRVKLDISLGLIKPEVRDDLVSRRLGATVCSHSRDVQL